MVEEEELNIKKIKNYFENLKIGELRKLDTQELDDLSYLLQDTIKIILAVKKQVKIFGGQKI